MYFINMWKLWDNRIGELIGIFGIARYTEKNMFTDEEGTKTGWSFVKIILVTEKMYPIQ